MPTMTDKIHETIELLKELDINGCISGSSLLPNINFDAWDSVPDVDVFVYSRPQLNYAVNLLLMAYGFEPLTKGEKWKIDRINNHDTKKKLPVETIKVTKDDVIVNITYKNGKNNIFEVLASFDMSIIMIGYDIRKHVMLDLRCGWDGMVMEDNDGRWSKFPTVAVPNPLRDQDVDMYGAAMWTRQWDRVIKYWGRGFDTRPMARFYIRLITGVIETGQLFETERSEEAFNDFKETYEPLKQRMEAWLKDKEDC